MKITSRELQDPTRGQINPSEGASGASFGDNRHSRYGWSWESINRYAPEAPGIYGLYNALWIYIGQTKNLRAQMLGHLYGDNPCIAHYQPSGFAFELVSPQDHRRRFEELWRVRNEFVEAYDSVHEDRSGGCLAPVRSKHASEFRR